LLLLVLLAETRTAATTERSVDRRGRHATAFAAAAAK
jgi:hypothetical protein